MKITLKYHPLKNLLVTLHNNYKGHIDVQTQPNHHHNTKDRHMKLTIHADHSLEQLMNPPEAPASEQGVSGSSPCLFSTSPMSHRHLLIKLMIICLACDRTHAWQTSRTWAGHSWCSLIEPAGWCSQFEWSTLQPCLLLTSVGYASTLIWGVH